jgi:hypothetical protein
MMLFIDILWVKVEVAELQKQRTSGKRRRNQAIC